MERRPALVQVGRLALSPYAYEEDTADGARLIILRARLSVEEVEWLGSVVFDGQPFAVTRDGIDGTPRRMMLTQAAWSADSSGAKCYLVLVDAVEHRRPLMSLDSQRERLALSRSAAAITGRLGALIGRLTAAGVLSADDVRAIEEEARQRHDQERWNLLRVENLDEWD